MANNFNYNYLNAEKYFINKIWDEKIINNYDKGLNNLNNKFNEKLDLIVNLDENLNNTGRYLDDTFNNDNFGVRSLKKIKNINFGEIDKYYVLDTSTKKFFFNLNNNQKIANKIVSNEIYKYIVSVDNEKLYSYIDDNFNSKITYSIELIEKTKNYLIENIIFSNDLLQFYNNNFFYSINNVSVIVNEEYYVVDIINYGEVYNFLLEYNIESSKNIKYYYQSQEIFFIEKVIENNISRYLFTNFSIDNNIKYIKLEYSVYIVSFNYFSDNLTFLKFMDSFDNFYFINTSSNYDVYIEINNISYLLEYDYSENLYFVNNNIFDNEETNNINNFTKKNIITYIYKFVKINNIINEEYKYAKIKFNRNIKNYINNIQTDYSIGSNITSNINNFNISGIKTSKSNEIFIKYFYDDNIDNIINKPLILNYRLNESSNYKPNKIKKIKKYLYKIKNNFSFKENDNINLDLQILYDFDNNEIDTSVINCELYEITEEEIKFMVPLSDSLLEYDNNEILENDDIINNSYLKFYKESDISNKVLTDRMIVKNYNNDSMLYTIFELDDDFIFSHYYKLENEITLQNNDVINILKYFFSIDILEVKFIVELIGEFLWGSNEFIPFKTLQPKLLKNREITINYEVSRLSLTSTDTDTIIWKDEGTNSNSNLKQFIKNENIKIFNLNNKNYGIIRAKSTGNFTFENDYIIYKINNNKNINLELSLNINFPIDSEYTFNLDEFNNSASNITTTKINFSKDYDNLVSLLVLVRNENYNYKLIFESEENKLIRNIINYKFFSDKIEIEVDDDIIINSFYYTNYKLIEKIKNNNIEKNDYFELYELELKQNIPIFLNKGNFFETQFFWLDKNLSSIPFNNTYFIKITDTSRWNYTSYMYLNINGIINDIYIISMIIFENNDNNFDHYILLSTDAIINNSDQTQIISKNWNKTKNISNFLELFNFKMDIFIKTLFYNYNSNYSKIYLFTKFKEFNYFSFISDISENNFNNYNSDLEITDNNFLLRFKFEKINLINDSYKNIGINKIENIIEYNSVTEKEIYDPFWVKDLQLKIFKSIELLFDDNIIEKLDANMLRILYNFNFTIFKETSFDKIIRLNQDDNGIFFKLPLRFFFNTLNKFLPYCLMKKTNVSINFNINSLSNLITNLGIFENNIKPKIDIYYTTYFLEKNLVSELKNSQTFMLAQVCYNYTNYILNNNLTIIHPKIYNMVKDLFIVVDKIVYNDNINYDRDTRFSNYKDNYFNYQNNISDKFIIDKKIFDLIGNELELGSERINIFKNHSFLSFFDTHYIMYLEEKYLNYINEDLNNFSSVYSKKLTILVLYFKNIFYEIEIPRKQSIDKLTFKMNGINIIPLLNGNYFNDVIPYLKGYTLEDNHYVYSFGKNSKIKQPNGHVNLKLIEDFSIEITKNSNVSKAKLKLYSKEYKIIHFKNDKFVIIN